MFRSQKPSTPSNNDKQPFSYFVFLKMLTFTVLKSAAATGATQPLRVLLNEAASETCPVRTISNCQGRFFHDAKNNLKRGTAATFLQVSARNLVYGYFDEKSLTGRIAATFGAGFAGVTAATCYEVKFIRNNTMKMEGTVRGPAWKYNLPIMMFFTSRELGYSFGVFATDDFSFKKRLAAMMPIALITAMAHKLVSTELTKDIRQIAHEVPDYGNGFGEAFKKIAQGHYQKHSFKIIFNKPTNTPMLVANFIYATCGPNMFLWRLIYLGAFATMLKIANGEFPFASVKQLSRDGDSYKRAHHRM